MLQGLTSHIIGHRSLGWVELFVIRTSTGTVNEAAGYALNQQTVVDSELDDCIQLGLAAIKKVIELKTC